jgi:hypothetical protein
MKFTEKLVSFIFIFAGTSIAIWLSMNAMVGFLGMCK